MKSFLVFIFLFLFSCNKIHLQGNPDSTVGDSIETFDGSSEDLTSSEEQIHYLEIRCKGSGVVAIHETRIIEVVVIDGIIEDVEWNLVEYPEGHPPEIQEVNDFQAMITPSILGYYTIKANVKGYYGEEEDCVVSLRVVDPVVEFITACPETFSTYVPAFEILTADIVGGTEPIEVRWFPINLPVGIPEEDIDKFSSLTTELAINIILEGTYQLGFEATDSSDRRSSCVTTINALQSDNLIVILTWNPPDQSCLSSEQLPECDPTDLDLHLVNLERATSWFNSLDCYYNNCIASDGHFLNWDEEGDFDDPVLYRDDRRGYGPEVISINRPSPSHGYAFAVHVYDNEVSGFDLFPVRAIVEVFYKQARIFYSEETDLTSFVERSEDFWVVAQIHCSLDSCEVEPILDGNGDIIVFYHERARTTLW